MDKKNKYAYLLGKITAYTVAGCAAACVVGICVAATVKFYIWLF